MNLLEFCAGDDWHPIYFLDGEECAATEVFERVEIWIVAGTQYVFAGVDCTDWYLGEYEQLSDGTRDPAFSCDAPITWAELFAVARKHYVEAVEAVHPKLLEVIRAEPWAQDCAAVEQSEVELDSVLCAQCDCSVCAPPVVEPVDFRVCVA